MRIFMDFEFIENGKKYPIHPISVGLMREDGKSYYAEWKDIPWFLANDWVLENVKPLLAGGEYIKTNDTIKEEILEFCGQSPEFWGYFADYDWVVMCQIFGNMTDLPESHGWPFLCLDLKQEMIRLGVTREDLNFIENDELHNALADAEWNRRVYRLLKGNK